MYYKLQATSGVDVTPTDDKHILKSDGVTKTRGCLIYVGTGGNLVVTTVSGEEVTFKNVPDGMILPVQVIVVHATSTTAADLIALH